MKKVNIITGVGFEQRALLPVHSLILEISELITVLSLNANVYFDVSW